LRASSSTLPSGPRTAAGTPERQHAGGNGKRQARGAKLLWAERLGGAPMLRSKTLAHQRTSFALKPDALLLEQRSDTVVVTWEPGTAGGHANSEYRANIAWRPCRRRCQSHRMFVGQHSDMGRTCHRSGLCNLPSTRLRNCQFMAGSWLSLSLADGPPFLAGRSAPAPTSTGGEAKQVSRATKNPHWWPVNSPPLVGWRGGSRRRLAERRRGAPSGARCRRAARSGGGPVGGR